MALVIYCLIAIKKKNPKCIIALNKNYYCLALRTSSLQEVKRLAQSVAHCWWSEGFLPRIPEPWPHVFIVLQIFIIVLLFVTLIYLSMDKPSRLVTVLSRKLGAKGVFFFFNVYLWVAVMKKQGSFLKPWYSHGIGYRALSGPYISSSEAVPTAALEFTSGPVYEPPQTVRLVSEHYTLYLTKNGIPELCSPTWFTTLGSRWCWILSRHQRTKICQLWGFFGWGLGDEGRKGLRLWRPYPEKTEIVWKRGHLVGTGTRPS